MAFETLAAAQSLALRIAKNLGLSVAGKRKVLSRPTRTGRPSSNALGTECGLPLPAAKAFEIASGDRPSVSPRPMRTHDWCNV